MKITTYMSLRLKNVRLGSPTYGGCVMNTTACSISYGNSLKRFAPVASEAFFEEVIQ